jgi:hypothetical protein
MLNFYRFWPKTLSVRSSIMPIMGNYSSNKKERFRVQGSRFRAKN